MATGERHGDPVGLDLARFAAWFARACPGEVTGPLWGRPFTGGRSNLTYEVGDGVRSWVVRRPPLAHVLATAHDMAREHRVLTALRGTGVPVPATYALCEDTEVLGAPFYVMERVAGVPYKLATELEALGPQRTRGVAEAMVDTLAVLHAVDPAAVGLGDFGRPDGFLARQVRRWKKQLDASRSRDIAGIDELHHRLAVNPPDGTSTAVVHGDYRLDNLLVDADDRVAAVVDWEMATLADPLTDVALLVVYLRLGGLDGEGAAADVTQAPGFPTERELLDRYAARAGHELSDLGFHIALAAFKLAVILEGIHYRHTHEQTVDASVEHVSSLVEPLVDAGLTSLKDYR